MALLLLLAFIIGALTVVAIEAAGLWILIRRLDRKVEREENKAKSAVSVSCPGDLNPSLHDKQVINLILYPSDYVSHALSYWKVRVSVPPFVSDSYICNYACVSVLKSSHYYWVPKLKNEIVCFANHLFKT